MHQRIESFSARELNLLKELKSLEKDRLILKENKEPEISEEELEQKYYKCADVKFDIPITWKKLSIEELKDIVNKAEESGLEILAYYQRYSDPADNNLNIKIRNRQKLTKEEIRKTIREKYMEKRGRKLGAISQRIAEIKKELKI